MEDFSGGPQIWGERRLPPRVKSGVIKKKKENTELRKDEINKADDSVFSRNHLRSKMV